MCDPLLDYNVWSTLHPINSSGKVDPEKEVIIVATRVGTSYSCLVEHELEGFWEDVGLESHGHILLLISWWAYLLSQCKGICILFLSCCVRLFSILFADGTRQVEIVSVSVVLS